MDREQLEKRRAELRVQLERAVAVVNRLQGALAVLDELIEAEATEAKAEE